jgi:hypothetical protein
VIFAVGLLILLAPISLFVTHIILSGYVLRRVLFSQQKKALWQKVAILMFSFPFIVWYGALPAASLLGDGLNYLSDLL